MASARTCSSTACRIGWSGDPFPQSGDSGGNSTADKGVPRDNSVVNAARRIDEETGKALVEDVLCQGCGACAGICPNKATVQHLYRQTQIMHMLEPVGEAATVVKEETGS